MLTIHFWGHAANHTQQGLIQCSQKVITEDNGATSVCEQNRAPNVHSFVKSLVRNYRVKKEIIKVYLGVF